MTVSNIIVYLPYFGGAFFPEVRKTMKVNKKATTKANPKALSKDGVVAFKKTPITELCDRVLTCFYGEEKGYESGSEATKELIKLVHQVATVEPVFVAKLAILARETFHLRTVPQVIAVELANYHKGDSMISSLLGRIIQRPDEMSDVLAYYIKMHTQEVRDVHGRTSHTGKKIPAQIRKGIEKALRKFDEYQLSKYKGTRKEVKLRDVIRIIHPKPLDEKQSDLWKRVITDELATANTWEVALSNAGQSAKNDDGTVDRTALETLKRDAWESKIINKELGYMAALRNIRNIIQANVSAEAHKKLQEYISNEKAVLNSKQLPFRFYSAYRAIANEVSDPFLQKGYQLALNRALYHSGKNLPKITGRTAIVSDLSGSMTWKTISEDSDIKLVEVGAVLSVIASQFCENSINIGFASFVKVINFETNESNTLDNVSKILNLQLGGGTNTAGVIKYLIDNKISVDNIIIFTDGQYNVGEYTSLEKTYRKDINESVVVYNVDLAGYGTTQHDPKNPNNVFVSGWSDNILRYISDRKKYQDGIVDMVNQVEFIY